MKPFKHMGRRALSLGLATGVLLASTILPAGAAVNPPAVDLTLSPGESADIDKTVGTPAIAPNPDIVFLADSTGSMGGAIADVQTNATTILNTVLASQPTAQFAVAEYRDIGDAFVWQVTQDITANQTDVQNAINGWVASGGGDTPEAQLIALDGIATGGVTFRADSTRIVVWFGDAPGHEGGSYPTTADVIAALNAADIQVVAVNVGAGGLDVTGQATAITSGTGGSLETTATDVADAILAGLSNLPVTVTPHAVGCDPLNVSFAPASQTVTSGTDASFVETISVPADDSLQGTSVTCTVEFRIGDDVIGVQDVTVTIPDTTAPVCECVETTNPGGNNTPKAGPNAGNSGQNPDGFYELLATDNVDADVEIFIRDAGSGVVFGPFPSGTKIKYTQAPGATPSQKPGPGVIDWQIKGQGDAEVFAVDSSGNVSDVFDCLVAPLPK